MQFENLLAPRRVQHGVDGVSKKRALEILADLISNDIPSLSADDLFRSLVARERLGSTGLGHGIAIPHCRVAKCEATIGALIILSKPIDFDAIDGEPVDVIFSLMVPEEANGEHLQMLAKLAELFQQEDFRAQLRSADSDQLLYSRVVQHLTAV
ncbi:PTS sugar transporter subunit IIA [Simiduia aestuariiviva]|uniref:PTS system nitrogen regulatory IIA component n=1 Tax=Simiduia aestuariiviva TaxID=1510459 RepID=A0A839UUV8_9GAMM|nr:PTS sugar transporter subunit IIA [Simiduia aestuariiviva]MBB3169157.1 PTS system nitrogen regulatory IIA component [Simiduia aestuariiviva]